MVYTSFAEIIASAKSLPEKTRMAVAAADDAHSLEAALLARQEGIVDPVLVGDRDVIRALLNQLGETVPGEDIYDAADVTEAAEKAVALVREGKAQFLLKGKLDTKILLKAVVNREKGLGTGRLMSHFTVTSRMHSLPMLDIACGVLAGNASGFTCNSVSNAAPR